MEEILRNILKEVLQEISQPTQWMTRKMIKEEMGVGERTVQKWEEDGLKCIKGRPTLYSRTELNKYLERKLNGR